MDIKESFYRVIDKLSEGADVTMAQLQKKFKDGTHEAINDPKPGYHVELRNTKTGKRTTHYVKEETALAEEKASQEEAAYQAKPNGSEKCSECTMWRAPNKCTAVEGVISPSGWCKWYEAKEEVKEQAHADPKTVALKAVKPHVTDDTTTTLPYDVKPQRVKLAQFKHLFN